MSKSQEVAGWLNTLPLIVDAVPVLVTLDTTAKVPQVYEGAYYHQMSAGAPGSFAAHKERLTWDSRFYLLGEVPKCKQRREKTCFRLPGEPWDWYIGGGYTPHLLRPFGPANFKHIHSGADLRQYHPFGHNFMLHVWALANGESIDQYEEKSYNRRMMEVLWL